MEGLSNLLARLVRDVPLAHKRARRLSEADIDVLMTEYRAGSSVYDLAARHHIDRGVIAQHLKARGISFRPNVQPAEVKRALELHAQGHSPNKIGELLGRDPKTIRSLLCRNGPQV